MCLLPTPCAPEWKQTAETQFDQSSDRSRGTSQIWLSCWRCLQPFFCFSCSIISLSMLKVNDSSRLKAKGLLKMIKRGCISGRECNPCLCERMFFSNGCERPLWSPLQASTHSWSMSFNPFPVSFWFGVDSDPCCWQCSITQSYCVRSHPLQFSLLAVVSLGCIRRNLKRLVWSVSSLS